MCIKRERSWYYDSDDSDYDAALDYSSTSFMQDILEAFDQVYVLIQRFVNKQKCFFLLLF